MAGPELAAFIALLNSRSGTSWPCSVPRGLFHPPSRVVVFSMVSKRFANVPARGFTTRCWPSSAWQYGRTRSRA
jgi:hypothetical protein